MLYIKGPGATLLFGDRTFICRRYFFVISCRLFFSTDTIILTSRPLRKCFNDLLFSNFKIFLRIFIHLARYTNRTLHKIQTRSKQFLLISFKNCFPSKQTIEMYRGCHKMNTYTFPFIYIHAFSLKKHFNTINL